MAHTPGPWRIVGSSIIPLDQYRHKNYDGSMNSVAMVWEHDKPAGEYASNAHLIAAAPEMLQALEYVVQVRKVECSAHPEGFDDICAYCKIRAAISKATGGA